MKINKPNHICKYSKCNLGEDGGAKHYYACDYCDRTDSWRSSACCIEHYELYIQEVLEARSKGNKIDVLPNRTDKSKDEVVELLETPVEEVKKRTEAELSEYLEDNKSLDEAIEEINAEIDKKPRNRKKRK